PHYVKMEDHFLSGSGHGSGGPMKIRRLTTPDPVTHSFVAAAAAHGVPLTDDLSGPRLEGVQLAPTTTAGGRRWSTARGYLDPARRRKNLTVMTNALVRRVLTSDGAAVGVEVERKGEISRIESRADIVVSGGAFN